MRGKEKKGGKKNVARVLKRENYFNFVSLLMNFYHGLKENNPNTKPGKGVFILKPKEILY